MLEICDKTTSEQIVAAEKHLAEVEKDSDFDDDLAVVTSNNSGKKNKNTGNDDSEVGSPSDDEISDTMDMDDDKYDETDSNDSQQSKSDLTDDEILESKHHSKRVNSNAKIKNKKSVEVVSESDKINVFSDDEISHLSDDGDEDEEDNDNEENIDTSEKAKQEKTWEDIYGRKRDKDGNIIKVWYYIILTCNSSSILAYIRHIDNY